MILIDGSILEGGGQILRIALSLSALFKKPVKISKIRAGRKQPGLAAQHLASVELCKSLCNASVTGAIKGSTEIEFYPGELTPGKFAATINTAGSVALLIQAALPIGLFCPGAVELELKGGTNTEMAPQLDFCTEVFRPNLEKFGATFDFEMIKRGYFPRGGGHCILRINNNSDLKELQPVVMTEMGRIRDCYGWSFVAGSVPMSVANEMGRGAEDAFSQSNLVDNSMKVNIECYKEDQKIAKDNCSGVIVCCETDKRCLIGGSGLGNKQEQPKQTGVKAVQEVIDSILVGACVDEHVQDQLIIFMALAKGTSRIRTGPITLHTKTAIHMCEKMTDAKFAVVADGKTFVIECQGVGLKKG